MGVERDVVVENSPETLSVGVGTQLAKALLTVRSLLRTQSPVTLSISKCTISTSPPGWQVLPTFHFLFALVLRPGKCENRRCFSADFGERVSRRQKRED